MITLDKTTVEQAFIDRLKSGSHQRTESPLKEHALRALENLSFPDRRNEEWKYTRVTRILNASFPAQKTESVQVPTAAGPWQLTFLNGRFLSDSSILPDPSVIEVSIGEGSNQSVADFRSDEEYSGGEIFKALNHAYHQESLFIRIRKNVAAGNVLHVVHYTAGSAISQPLIAVLAEESSEARLTIELRSLDDSETLTNAALHVRLMANSRVSVDKLLVHSSSSYAIFSETAQQHADSTFNIGTACLGGSITRNTLKVFSKGRNTQTGMYGMSFGAEGQHIDNATAMHHQQPDCSSYEMYKSVMAGKSTGVFNGKVVVYQDAQKTDAYQSSTNLLLSADATVNSKPELEIYADDVKCSHGSTTGQLDPNQLFYLKARGIGEEAGKRLLLEAFCGEVLDHFACEEIREEVMNRVREKVAQL
jgi:Fe-S cluster assembly protein SufD